MAQVLVSVIGIPKVSGVGMLVINLMSLDSSFFVRMKSNSPDSLVFFVGQNPECFLCLT